MILEVQYNFEPYAEGSCRVMVTLELPRGSICSIQVGTDAWTELWRALEPLLKLALVRNYERQLDRLYVGTEVPLP